MPTPTLKTGLSASEWKARYAEISHLYVGSSVQIPKPINWERVRQAEEFAYRLREPAGTYTPNIRIPTDLEFAARAFLAFCDLPLT